MTKCSVALAALLTVAAANAQTGTFVATGSMNSTRIYQTATLLPNGKVLVAGGYANAGPSGPVASADLYDPATGTFSATGSMTTPRAQFTAALLPNGKVLIAGGDNGAFPLASAELYDPATGTFTATGSMTTQRYAHTSTLLPNGKVLIAGGCGNPGSCVDLMSAELYDPTTGAFSVTGSMITARRADTMTLLPNGKVLVSGGFNESLSGSLASAELYDQTTGIFSATGSLIAARYAHSATVLPNGKVLVAGGGGNSGALASAELYDPTPGTFSATGSMITTDGGPATLLPDGEVLVAGGGGSAELYDPTTGTFSATGSLTTARGAPTATLLPNGEVLVAGGANSVVLASAELYISISVPTDKDQCKNNGWMTLFRPDGSPFKNQGDCIQFVNTGK
jgi:hypothetical protein